MNLIFTHYSNGLRLVVIMMIALQVACNQSASSTDTDGDCNAKIPTDSISTDSSSDENGSTDSSAQSSTDSSSETDETTTAWSGRGCGREVSPGEQVLTFGDTSTPYFVTVPEDYDKNSLTPVVYAFHGYGRSYNEMRTTDSSGLDEALSSWAVVVYPMAVDGLGWDSTQETEADMQMFEALHRRVLGDFCIDPDRVFATGLSSGGFFTGSLACRKGDILRGVGIVSGAVEDQQDCLGNVAAVVIHGERDAVVPSAHGWEARDYFARVNGCSEETAAGVTPECVEYQGCNPDYPVQWCTHDEATYENTNHGWPSFASEVIDNFFKELTTPSPPTSENNLLPDESFNVEGDTHWSLSTSNAAADAKMRGDQLCITVTSAGVNDWDVQLTSPPIGVLDGRSYSLDYRAWSDSPAKMRVRIGQSESPYTEYWTSRVRLDVQPKRFFREFTMSETDDSAASIAFQVGGNPTGRVPVTICIYDVVAAEESVK